MDIKKVYPLRRASIWLVQIAVPVLVLFIAGKCSAESLRDYYPLRVGNEWRYIQRRDNPEIGLRDTSYVQRRIAAIVTLEQKEYFEITVEISEGQRVFYQRYNVSGDTLWEYDEDRQQDFVRYHVELDTLEQSLYMVYSGLIYREPSFEGWMICSEPITTPAAVFEDAIFYRYSRYYQIFFGSGHGEIRWFARNIGPIRAYRWAINEIHQMLQTEMSLIYAKVGGVEYGTKYTAIESFTWGQIKSLFR